MLGTSTVGSPSCTATWTGRTGWKGDGSGVTRRSGTTGRDSGAFIDPLVEPLGFRLDDDGGVVVQVHQVVRDRAGHVLSDRDVEHAYRVEDGLIRRMEILAPS